MFDKVRVTKEEYRTVTFERKSNYHRYGLTTSPGIGEEKGDLTIKARGDIVSE